MSCLEKADFIQVVLERAIEEILRHTRSLIDKTQVDLRFQNAGRSINVWQSGKNFTVRISEDGDVYIEMIAYNPRRSYSEKIYTYEPDKESQDKFFLDFYHLLDTLLLLHLDRFRDWFGDYLWYLEKYQNLDDALNIMRYDYWLENNHIDEDIDLLSVLEGRQIWHL